MFTIISLFLLLILYPFALGPALPFHMIKEENRYIRRDISVSQEELFLLNVCFGIIAFLLFLGKYLPVSLSKTLFFIDLITLGFLFVLNIFKIVFSLINQVDVSVFGFGPATSRTMKFVSVFICTVFLLAVLEQLGIIPSDISFLN